MNYRLERPLKAFIDGELALEIKPRISTGALKKTLPFGLPDEDFPIRKSTVAAETKEGMQWLITRLEEMSAQQGSEYFEDGGALDAEHVRL
ncbi:hypothetical protein [Ruegeria profundi]|uniref:hypothetical protein n=1 Tax=Ruegeria profundi TaxID=1685378 RepID=UPI00147011CE|nr:hypothetical protein [Ruegeria profundi]